VYIYYYNSDFGAHVLLEAFNGNNAVMQDDNITRTYTWGYGTGFVIDVTGLPAGPLKIMAAGETSGGDRYLTEINTNITVVPPGGDQ
jgi:hypothetical protein